MIFGMGRIGSAIFQNLQEKNIKVVGFDADTDLVKKYLKDGKSVAFVDAEDPGFGLNKIWKTQNNNIITTRISFSKLVN